MPTPPPTITAAPTAPQRGVKATFSTLLDAFLTWLVAAVSQFGAVATNVFNNATEAFNSATTATTKAGEAVDAAAAATTAANATLWVSGQSVAQDAAKISPLDRRTYRRKTATGSGTTDPSLDPTNYVLLSAGAALQLHVRDEKASGTQGGTATAQTWNTRTLNTSKTNTIVGASLSSNQITLPAGTYEYDGTAPAAQCDEHKARLYNVTDGVIIDVGSGEFAPTAASSVSRSVLRGTFTLSATKVLELQHWIKSAGQTYTLGLAGFGNPSGAVEVYAEIRFRKVA